MSRRGPSNIEAFRRITRDDQQLEQDIAAISDQLEQRGHQCGHPVLSDPKCTDIDCVRRREFLKLRSEMWALGREMKDKILRQTLTKNPGGRPRGSAIENLVMAAQQVLGAEASTSQVRDYVSARLGYEPDETSIRRIRRKGATARSGSGRN